MDNEAENVHFEEKFYFAVKLIIFLFFVLIFCFMYCLVSRCHSNAQKKSNQQFRGEKLTSIAVIS